jgi:hypothetical protein
MGSAVHMAGPGDSVPLADAREKAASARRKIAQGKPLSQMARLLLSATLFCKSCSQVIFDTSIVTCA